MSKLYNSKYKLKLKEIINKLEYNEQCEIFNIIKKDTDKISENNNGVFINLKYLKDDTICKIVEFVEYCNKNKENLKKDDEINNDTKDTNTHLISKEYELYKSNNTKKYENFLFKTYIDKISISSNSYFENITKLNPIIKNSSIQFEGVEKIIYNKCKNINKDTNNQQNTKIENILDEHYGYNSDEYINDEISIDKISNELTEDLNYL